jgi:heterodisulfide reductase subunit C
VQQKPSYSRRALTRLSTSEDIWLCWQCNECDDVSRVLDISIDGLFIETPRLSVKEGMPAKLDFLVQEGRIKADAVVRHIKRGNGLGLRFIALAENDRQRLKALLTRLRTRGAHPSSHPFPQLEQL